MNCAADCPRDAFWHLRNASDHTDEAFLCNHCLRTVLDRHFKVAELHQAGPDCGMPGAVWDDESNTCNVPDSFCSGLADALAHEFDGVAA